MSELFWAGQESWNTAVRSRRARTQRLRLQEDPRREFKAHLNARALLPLPGLEVSTARCSGTAPNHTPYRTLIPTLNPIADRLIPDLHPAEAQATDTPIPGAGTLVGSTEREFLGIDFCDEFSPTADSQMLTDPNCLGRSMWTIRKLRKEKECF